MKAGIFNLFSRITLLASVTIMLAASREANAQSFTSDDPLLNARWQQLSLLLTNGQVLIVGGRVANDFGTSQFANTNSCELYDPGTGGSRFTAPMSTAHMAGAIAMLTNGLVLTAGGQGNGFGDVNSAELYNTATATWTNTGSMSHSREAFASAPLPNGKFLVAGGYDNSQGADLAGAEIYNPATGTWSNAASMPFQADSQTATTLADGTVLVTGGSDNGNLLTNVMLYNPANNSWSNTQPLHVGRASHQAVLLPNGRVMVVGGDDTAEIYDPVNRNWTVTASMSTGRPYPSATLLPDGTVLVIGGDPGQTSAEIYNPSNNTWSVTGPLNVGRVFHSATLVSAGQVVVAGGDAGTIGFFNGPPQTDIETFNQSPTVNPVGLALSAQNVTWTTSGDQNWFPETTNTYVSIYGEQSGVVTNDESTTMTTTVTGPGTITFYWSSIANDTNLGFDFEFYIDDPFADDTADLFGNNDWQRAGPYNIPDGVHTLNWTVFANGDTDPTQAGFLDHVTFTGPVETNPVALPVGWWKGEGNAVDSAGTNNGTLQSNVTFSPGVLGRAFDFDGSGGDVEIPGVSVGLAQGTISLWANLRSWDWQSADNGTFLWAGTEHLPNSDGSFDGINLGNHPAFTSTGELMFGIFTSDWQWAHSGVVPQTNTWYHVAGTWGPGGVRIFVNGQLKGSNSYTGPAPSYTLYNLIGRSSWGSSQINGLVDDVRLYNRALSPAEINGLANPINHPTLLITSPSPNAVLTWPEAAYSFTLQSSPSLSSPNWTPVTNTISWVGTNFVVTNGASGPEKFYRLKQ